MNTSKSERIQLGNHKAELIATAAAIASATTAMGESIRFDTASFSWTNSLLDLTLASDAQVYGNPGDASGTSIYLDYFGDFYPTFSYQHTYTSGGGAEIFNGGFSYGYAKPLDFGTLIGPDLVDGQFSAGSSLDFVWSAYDYYTGEPSNGNRGILPQGVDTYIGVRLDIDGATHYGWIGLNMHGAHPDVFAWGYETVAGVAVGAGVPAPGALGVLAVGAAGTLRRKKRAG